MGEPNYKILRESLEAATKEFNTFVRFKTKQTPIQMYAAECELIDLGTGPTIPNNDYDLYLWLFPYSFDSNMMLTAGNICDVNEEGRPTFASMFINSEFY